MARGFTTKGVEAIKPNLARRQELPDPALSGLYLVVQPGGTKSWALRYRFAGKPAKLTLGRWPVMGVGDARAAATDALEEVEHGRNPAVAKKAAKADQREAQLTERDKVKTLVEQFDKRHLSNLRSGAGVRRALDAHVVKEWGDRDIHEITKRDVIDLLDKIVDSGRQTTANRVRAYTGKFFNWCVERDILATNPAAGVKPVAKEVARDRVLTDDEIRWFWQACDKVGYPWGGFGKLSLLTGQRRQEVAAMTYAEIEGDLWSLPAERVKNGRAHNVPLSEAALDVLASVPRIAGSGLVLTTTGDTPVSGFAKGHDRLAKKMAEIAFKEREEPVEIPHWTFHDLRRTAATGMARLAIPVRVTEACLNHVSGTAAGIVSVYQRHDYAPEKRQAMEAWGRFVTELVEGKPDNVVRLAEAG
ncbi:tyrosine-type recombinase/integrase [Pseudoblastomonas halimionae]|uniref:Integrase arm-type DNA-binding domain-containing protein n=1 Tax=Alteriqipengyuania halimionae TaxID=1926630 RepID=A0A6I4U150_9SPHN|nr:site-specific integrase [Alteriqipengyuania halimionae]MXP09608.1 integrase arm-type DNA-binding domain-containing protein [Alteriqipengyuania halimionae]